MKKITISKKTTVISVIILVMILSVAGIMGIRAYQTRKLVDDQNYVASRLLEMGEYTKGGILAAQSEQIRVNETSEVLMILSAGLNADYDIAMLYADRYMQRNNAEKILQVYTLLEDYQETLKKLEEAETYDYEAITKLEERTYNEQMLLLLRIQEEIPVKKSDETLVAVTNYMTGVASGSVVMEQISADNSLLAKSVQAEYALNIGDYEDAFGQMESLLNSNASFEYKARLANMAVNTAYNTVDDEETMQLQVERSELNQNLYELYNTLNQETNSVKKGELKERIQKLEEEILALEKEIAAIPAKKAINYIQMSASPADKGNKAYQIEMARLCYMANESEQAKNILQEIIRDEDESEEVVNVLLQNIKDSYLDKKSDRMNKLWQQLAGVLGFEQGNYYNMSENGFYQFMQTVLDDIYNGLVIRDINTLDYPIVRVTFNVAAERNRPLKKKDVSLFDQFESVSQFTLLPASEVEMDTQMSVELVVDISGSMDGAPLEDTKKAVNNFIQNLGADINAGVVAFENTAHVVAPISDNHGMAIQGVNELFASGGTSIYSGLALAAEQLENSSGKKIIILMSDGVDGSYIDDLLMELNQRNVIVYTIGFGGTNAEYLSHIAASCGGKFIYADSSQMLTEIYAAVGEYMVNDYVLEFTVETDTEEFDRVLEINLDKEGIFAEKNYHIGVTAEEIQAEEGMRPQADYFEEVGGSDMSAAE